MTSNIDSVHFINIIKDPIKIVSILVISIVLATIMIKLSGGLTGLATFAVSFTISVLGLMVAGYANKSKSTDG